MAELNLALIISLVDKLSGPVKKVTGSLGGLQGAAAKLAAHGERMKAWGEGMQRNALMVGETGRQLREGLMGILEPSMEMDQMRQKLLSIDGLSEQMAERAMGRADAWQKVHANSDDEYLAGFAQMYQATRNLSQALAGTETALTVNKAIGGDLGITVAMLTRLYDNFGDHTRDAGAEMARMGDIVVATKQRFNLRELEQLEMGVRGSALAAQSARLPFSQLATVIGAMAGAGKEGRMAGGAISSLLDRMDSAGAKLRFQVAYDPKGGLDLINTIENIKAKYGDLTGLTVAQQQAFDQAFGGPGISNEVSFLIRNIDVIQARQKEIEASTGAAAKARDEREKSFNDRLQITNQSWTKLKETLGNALLPQINELLPKVTALVQWFDDVASAHPGIARLALGFMAVGAAVFTVAAPIMSVVGSLSVLAYYPLATFEKIAKGFEKITHAVHGLNASLASNPVGWIVGILAATVAVSVAVYQNWDRLGALAERVFGKRLGQVVLGGLTALIPIFGGPIAALKNLEKGWADTKARLAPHAKEITAVINGAWAGIRAAISWSPLGMIQRAWGGVLGWARAHTRDIAAVINAGWALIQKGIAISPLGALMAAWGPVKSFFTDLWASIVAAFRVGKAILGPILDWLQGALQPVLDALRPVLDILKALQTSLGSQWKGFVDQYGGKNMGPGAAIMGALALAPGGPALPSGPGQKSLVPLTPISGPVEPGGPGGGAPAQAGGKPAPVVHQTNSYQITVAAAPGQDVKAIAEEVMRQIKRAEAQSHREALHDAF